VTTRSNPDFEAFLATAHRLADRAAEVILPHFRAGGAVDHKGGVEFDPVTAADLAAETALRAILAETYPEHSILGEEFGAIRRESEYCWVLDPIDGTRAFIIGQPLWGSLIGLTRKGDPLLGLMDQPFTRERFWSGAGEAWFRHAGLERTMRCRACGSLPEAMLVTTSPDMFASDELPRFELLSRKVRLRRFGGDCYNYCLLALGQIDLVVEAGLKPYDILPLIPIITRAGGIATTWDGGDPRNGGRILAAGDPRLHAEAVRVLTG
jgi:histidinol phosphatase-like enzyme (inositol monophosphatase family)